MKTYWQIRFVLYRVTLLGEVESWGRCRNSSFHELIRRSLEIEFVHGIEKSRACAREARKMHFCTPRQASAHAHYKLEFDDAERQSGRSDDNRTQKFSYYLHIKKKRSKNKVALAVEISILSIVFHTAVVNMLWKEAKIKKCGFVTI